MLLFLTFSKRKDEKHPSFFTVSEPIKNSNFTALITAFSTEGNRLMINVFRIAADQDIRFLMNRFPNKLHPFVGLNLSPAPPRLLSL